MVILNKIQSPILFFVLPGTLKSWSGSSSLFLLFLVRLRASSDSMASRLRTPRRMQLWK